MEQISPENLEKQHIPSKEESLYMKKTILTEEDLIKESDLEPEEWINKYGEEFRRIITKNPELLKDKENLKKELYKEKIH